MPLKSYIIGLIQTSLTVEHYSYVLQYLNTHYHKKHPYYDRAYKEKANLIIPEIVNKLNDELSAVSPVVKTTVVSDDVSQNKKNINDGDDVETLDDKMKHNDDLVKEIENLKKENEMLKNKEISN